MCFTLFLGFLGPCASLLYSLWPLFFSFCFSLFLGFALHNIYAFHFRLPLFIFIQIKKKKKKREKKKEANCVLHYFFGFWKQGWSIYFHITCLLYLVQLWWAYLLHLTSWSLVVHVVWEKCLWFWSLCLDLDVIYLWLPDLNLLRKA